MRHPIVLTLAVAFVAGAPPVDGIAHGQTCPRAAHHTCAISPMNARYLSVPHAPVQAPAQPLAHTVS